MCYKNNWHTLRYTILLLKDIIYRKHHNECKSILDLQVISVNEHLNTIVIPAAFDNDDEWSKITNFNILNPLLKILHF